MVETKMILDETLPALPELREEILAMQQRVRTTRHATLNGREHEGISATINARMRAIIEQYGWPSSRLIGDDAEVAAWLLIEHSTDVELQRACLPLLEEAVACGEAYKCHLALLTDAVCVKSGQPQHYGTQFHVCRGEPIPYPIADAPNVDLRRARLGLTEPFRDYLARQRAEIRKLCGSRVWN